MKEVALYDAKNRLSALVQEVEETGAEVVITRHGKPAARIVPVVRTLTAAEKQAILAGMIARRDARVEPNDEPFDWKAAVEEGRE
jgi:prevent-host-death family protein